MWVIAKNKTDPFIKPLFYKIAKIKEWYQALRMQYLRYPSVVTSSELYSSHKTGFVHCFIPLTHNVSLIFLQNTNSNTVQVINGYSYLQLLWKATLKIIIKSTGNNCTEKRHTDYLYADSSAISTYSKIYQ